MKNDRHKPRSIAVSKGHQRAILKPCGVIDAEIDRPFISNRRLDLDVSAPEIQERLQRWRPQKKKLHGWMERYQAQVTSSNTGAVLTPDE